MTSTNVTIGVGERSGSRVLKPPGGQSCLSFGGEEAVRPNPPRPKYDQQNSSNLFGCMGNPDHLAKKETQAQPPAEGSEKPAEAGQEKGVEKQAPNEPAQQVNRGRVPPGGFSAGFW
uniref:Microtubule-associated protein Jupiter n=1 Tax=Nyssomyia neivai TaxID=330878 RepID=A0A1L8DD23_9DIPT